MTLTMLDLENAALGSRFPLDQVLGALPWNNDGLIAAIAQQHGSGTVLMLAWMNRQALDETLATGQVCYWSRSRQRLWRKGETSGHRQQLIEARLDCDGDAVLLIVDQQGPACHTGRPSCFYNTIADGQVHIITAPIEEQA
ncbi:MULTISPECIES: phosphoribosyl-AMP cyclohydrolase [unclassified Pseudomonas]|uniref:phosphoribosyl-AMP cyclohydrolase n=1 Tax=unclassified Pseudomonas TaxID=196821 RepID=UPI0011EBC1F4|nr:MULTISPECIES: phosphoribosyl-AMP cyclohydrolase [unclassified Pseudomonas]KAA0950593.1 phosphoribosyl-AMP cyclohydrolase [Pseudomonas sp. ANT_H4]KAA0952480.1 phosphoribosyl-AMP cyclohydrolase [Pseudomonas sp. ANT_H14]